MTTRPAPTSNRKTTPPQFKEEMSYKSWKNKIQMWQLVTSTDKKEQAIVFLLESLDSNTKAEFTATELNSDGGMELLIAKLDSVFQSKTVDKAYETYSKFINFLRQENNDMGGYIIELGHLYKHIRDFEMKLPDPVLAFKLLDGANINDERKLPLALGTDMKYEDMKSALKRLVNKSSTTTTQSAIIKQEETFYSKAKYKSPKYLSSNNKTKTIKHNPLNKHGEISRCVVCDSNMHWPDKCPHKSETGFAYLVEGMIVVMMMIT